MNPYKNTEKDIHTRIYKFVLGCFRDVVKKIPKTTENLSLIGQISSSLTSIGANDQEADGAATRRDFIAKYIIARKETRETIFWLSLTRDLALVDEVIITVYIHEAEEIRHIVSKIIENSQKHIE